MQLIGRKKELKTLNQAWKKEDAFILISGRHAVGKTAFIKTFADHKNHLYFAARSVSDQMNRLAFEQAYKQHLNGDILIIFPSLSTRNFVKFHFIEGSFAYSESASKSILSKITPIS